MKKTAILLALPLLVATLVLAQDNSDYFPTQNTTKDARPDPRKQGPKEPRVRYIITNDTKNTLAGNYCFEEETRKMGFLYLAVPKGLPPNKNDLSRWWHNLGVKTVILLKNGPFWKDRVNKMRKECRIRMGDYTG
jgi:hypothetical protein